MPSHPRVALARKISFCLFASCLALSSVSLAEPHTSLTDPPRLWVTSPQGTHQLRPEDPAFRLDLPGTQDVRALALDPGTRQVWLRGPDTMTLVDAEGHQFKMQFKMPGFS